METQNYKPRWWQLVELVSLLAVLLALDVHLPLTHPEHQFVQFGIVLLSWALWPDGFR